ncbi:MAG: 5'-methylthioadenosine/adenosylhomocysteine nucleosidase [Oscillospiraceae bacterium]|nr:5'-methylthioadenosine/adenosylhomocysteine nucleosidase [Oscillospiraceae bacterium]
MIGIIGAMASEVDGLKAIMENKRTETVSSVDFCSGTINGTDVVVAEAGVGKVNAAVTAQTMILRYNTDIVINIGVAGGLDKSLSIGDVVIADRVAEHDMDTTPLGDEPGFITGINRVYMECDPEIMQLLERCTEKIGIHTITGTIVSGDQFICRDDQREKLTGIFNAAAAEMEGASIGHVCTMNNVRFGVLRAISDGANSDSEMDFPTFCQMAADNSIEIIKLLLKEM